MEHSVKIALFLLTFTQSSMAGTLQTQVATITQIQGKAEIFTNPSKKPHENKSTENGTMVLFEGDYYLIQQAKLGDKIQNHSVLRTLPNARVNVVYDNGDQFNLGSGTAYRISWNEQSHSDAKMKLMYGRVRGVISKEGPRKKFSIQTRSATMGVRGTDFFIADEGVDGEIELSVLRGSVAVNTSKKDQEIKTGMSALITTTKEESKVAARETSKEDLSIIEKQSTITDPVALPAKSSELSKKIFELEKKAFEVTVKDIQIYQPELYKKVADAKNVQDLNAKLLSEVSAIAPEASSVKRRLPMPR
jgi:hypothetical protein